MNIEVIDAFGTKVGEAEVAFAPVQNPEVLAREITTIFPPSTTVTLPSADARCPWRLVVRP